jgi:predicted  nucleic acid-binding Zn-ribbon protein
MLLKLESSDALQGIECSVAGVDEAIGTLKGQIRTLRTEINKRSAVYDRLHPVDDVLLRQPSTIEKAKQREDQLRMERLVAQTQVSVAIDRRDSVQQRVQKLREKREVLRRHVMAVKEAVQAEQEELQRMFPYLTGDELTSGTLDAERLLSLKRHLVKEAKQLLLQRKSRYEHSIHGLDRVVEAAEASLAQKVEKAVKQHSVTKEATPERTRVSSDNTGADDQSSPGFLSTIAGDGDDASPTPRCKPKGTESSLVFFGSPMRKRAASTVRGRLMEAEQQQRLNIEKMFFESFAVLAGDHRISLLRFQEVSLSKQRTAH